MKQCVLLAMKGNTAALRMCMEWLARLSESSSYSAFRLPPVKSAADLPAALQALAKAVARGKIRAQGAQTMANMLEQMFRVSEAQAQQSSLRHEDTHVDLSRLTEKELEAAERLRQAAIQRGKDRE
jgi:membrane-bound lytic murein transglycosylase B